MPAIAGPGPESRARDTIQDSAEDARSPVAVSQGLHWWNIGSQNRQCSPGTLMCHMDILAERLNAQSDIINGFYLVRIFQPNQNLDPD